MPAATYKTLSDIINREDQYDLKNVTFYGTSVDGELIISSENLFNMYARYIAQFAVTYKVTDEYKKYYRFRPRLLSQDIYGTPDLAWLLMYLNFQECPSKFEMKSTLRIIEPEYLRQLYDTLVARQSETLAKNHKKYNALIGEEVTDYDN